MTTKINGIPKEDYYKQTNANNAEQGVYKSPKKQLIKLLILISLQTFFFIYPSTEHIMPLTHGFDFWAFMWTVSAILIPYDIYLLVSMFYLQFKKDDNPHKITLKQASFFVTVILLFTVVFIGHHLYRVSHNRQTGSSKCNTNYSGVCVQNVNYDLDCKDVRHRVGVIGKDVYHLDGDGNGIGCEAY